jgi:hypothetical protein
MKVIFTLLLLSFFSVLFAQDIKIEKAIINTIPGDWGIDNGLLTNEPIGSMAGVQNNNGTIYVAVNDTLSTANLGLVVFTSTDDGNTWSLHPQGVTLRDKFQKIKMIKSFADSIYCFFQYGSDVYSWNVVSGNFNAFPYSNYRTFDVVASSTGNLYMFLDSLPSNNVLRYSSINGGSTWGSRGSVSSAAAMPKVYMSGTGDTLVLNYYGPVLVDTATSVIRAARYVETGPGTLTSSGFQDVVTSNEPKYEFATAINNGEAWFVYTSGIEGSRNINARKSTTNGVSYDPIITLAGNVDRDEYWFDIKHFTGGFNLILYSDSAQVGAPTNESDILYHASVNYGSSVFSDAERISEVPPVYSANGYSPQIVTMPFSNNDVGALWVGDDAGSRKLYWDVESWVIPVELVSFNASVSINDVTLNWLTASEVNNSGFDIERQVSSRQYTVGNIWEKIGFVKGNGTTTENKSYSFTDINLAAGSYSYRLKQIDFNGSFEYSNIIEVEVSSPQNFELSQNYPNPFNPSTTISFSLPQNAFVILKIYDVIGNEVATLVNEEKSAGRYDINFNAVDLSSGVYFYSISAGSFNQVNKMTLIK